MKKKIFQLLLLASGSVLLIVFSIPQAHAQETASATAGTQPRKKLTGEVRWKKSIGLPPGPGADKPLANRCEPFYVIVLDPEQEDKVLWFANLLQPGRDNAEFYTCKYEIVGVPTNKRIKVIVGMGDPFAKPYGNDRPHWYRDKWVVEGGRNPEDEQRQGLLALPASLKIQLVFKPTEKIVMLTNKDMWLAFEMVVGVVHSRGY